MKLFFIIVLFTYFFLVSCINSRVSKKKLENTSTSINADSQLLRLSYQPALFYFPESSIRSQRKALNENNTPQSIIEYMKPRKEIDQLLEKNRLDFKIFQFEPNESNIIFNALQFLRQGDYQSVIEKSRLVLKDLQVNDSNLPIEAYTLSPYKEASLLLALAFIQTGDEIGAVQILEKLVENSKNWSPIYVVLSEYYYNKGYYLLSLDVSNRGVDLAIDINPYLYILQTKSNFALGDKKNARISLNRGEFLFPNNNEIILWKGILEHFEGNNALSCKYFLDSYFLDKKNPYTAHNYSYCLIKDSQYEKACEVLELAISNFPSNAHLYYLKGVLENNRGSYFAAQKSWQSYLSLIDENDPNYKIISFKLSQMSYSNK